MSEEGKTIGKVENGNILISIIEFKDKRYLDIRKYFADDHEELKPTKKGIALNKDQFESVLKILNEKKGDIDSSL